jgi:single-strand DNA-binding protein
MINNVTLVGRMTRDCELRYTSAGKAVGVFTLAVNRPFTNSNSEREADFINCVVWGKPAENLANYTRKGSLIGLTGRIQTRSYEKEGKRVYVTEILAENITFLDSKKSKESNPIKEAGGEPVDVGNDDLPF